MPGDYVIRDSDSGEIVDVVHLDDVEVPRYKAPIREWLRPTPGYDDDPSISTVSLARQLHVWQLEDQLEMERSPCPWFNDLESEPPTMDQLTGILKRRAAAAATQAVVQKRTESRNTAIVAFVMVSLMAMVVTVLAMMVWY